MKAEPITATTEDPWVLRYKRTMLDYLTAPSDVDLSTVTIEPAYDEGYDYSEYTQADPSFEIIVTGLQNSPQDMYHRAEDDGSYVHRRALYNEEVAEFLRSLI